MLWNLLSSEATRQAPIGEAALYALLGYLLVFFGIVFLILVVWAVGKLMTMLEQKAATPKQPEAVPQPEIVETSTEDEISDEVVAVITAAIAAYYQKENKKCEFTVKRIKRL